MNKPLQRLLKSLQASGIKSIPVAIPEVRTAEPEIEISARQAQVPAAERPTENEEQVVRESPSSFEKNLPVEPNDMNAKKRLTKKDKTAQLAIIEKEVCGCVKCPHLAETRTQTVFGTGNSNPRLCFVGEAPGKDEDKQGVPFVGRAGQLLDKILEACDLQRSDVYILNTIKCRPPSNRNPSDEELGNCWDYAIRQLDVLAPEFICCLGGVAAQTVLQTKTPIGKLRGDFHDFNGIKVMVTYHPAYLLRNPNAKKLVWDDMKTLMKEMGTPVD